MLYDCLETYDTFIPQKNHKHRYQRLSDENRLTAP